MSRVLLLCGGPQHGDLLAVESMEPIEYAEKTPDPRPFAKVNPDLPVTFRSRYYVPDKITSTDRDGTSWRLDIAMWDDYRSVTELLKTQVVMGAMVRYLPNVVEVAPEPWEGRP